MISSDYVFYYDYARNTYVIEKHCTLIDSMFIPI